MSCARRHERLAMVGVVLIAAALRLWRLDDLPGGLLFDEGYNGYDVLRVLDGARPIFFRENYGREPLFLYLQAGAVWLLGTKVYALRIVAAAFGLLAVPATYAATRRLAGGTAGLLAAAWVATAPWPLISSRIGLRTIATPALIALAIYLLARALDEPRDRLATRLASGGALALAAAIYTYVAARAAPLAVAIGYGLAALQPGMRQRVLRLSAVGTVVGLVALAPLGAHFARHPEDVWKRTDAVSQVNLGDAGDDRLGALGRGWLGTLGAFHLHGEDDWNRNLSGRPVFDPLGGVLFAVGVAAAIVRARRDRGARWLLVWLFVMLAPNALSTPSPNYSRMFGALPAVAGLAGLGGAICVGWLRGPARLCALATAALALWFGAAGVWTVFGDWARRPERFYSFGQDRALALRAAVEESRSGRRTYATGLDEFDQLARFVAGPVETRGFGTFDSRVALVLPPPDVPASHVLARGFGLPPELRALLPSAGATLALDTRGLPAVELFRSQSSAAPRLSRGLEAPVGDLAVLHGYALPRRAGPGDEIGLVISFETARADRRDLIWFAHLVDAEQRVWATRDLRGFPAAHWRPGDTAYLRFSLRVPEDAPEGVYRVIAGLYDRATFGRLPVGGGDSAALGPLWIGPASGAGGGTAAGGRRFGSAIQLERHEVVGGADRARLRLDWRAIEPPPRDYTAFVHVLDGAGRLVAQADGQPRRPTSTWEAGDLVVDEREVPLPAGAARLSLGLYEVETGRRLPLDGGGDALTIGLE